MIKNIVHKTKIINGETRGSIPKTMTAVKSNTKNEGKKSSILIYLYMLNMFHQINLC